MPYRPGLKIPLACLLGGVFLLAAVTAWGNYILPPTGPRQQYGNVVIDRASTRAGAKPVTFSHWTHRKNYNCGVCHSELDFDMQTGSSPIAESGHDSVRYCGACHNGTIAFDDQGHCSACHVDRGHYDKAEFPEFWRKNYPGDMYGNGVNWVRALRKGVIKPAAKLHYESGDLPFDKELTLQADLCRISPAIFPHKVHVEWMDCNTCHPDVFQIKKKTTEHFSMARILKGEFCGACHLTVSFPIHDCVKCHPDMKSFY